MKLDEKGLKAAINALFDVDEDASMRTKAEAAITAYLAATRQEDGWMLVPVEPTYEHLAKLANLWGYTIEETVDSYQAFLEALLAPPEGEKP